MFLTLFAVLVTPFTIGHVDRHGNVPFTSRAIHYGSRLDITLPPRAEITDESGRNLLSIDSVTTDHAHGTVRLPAYWIHQGSLQVFSSSGVGFYNVTFNGIQLINYSSRWIIVHGTINRYR